jgi:hypothetical protein
MLYRLHLDLLDSQPPIWRRLWINQTLPLTTCHRVFALTIGWDEAADYRFKPTLPPSNHPIQPSSPSADHTLGDWLLQPGDSLIYLYQPSQGWLHKITLETIANPGDDLTADGVPANPWLAHCLEGEGACPPEFCHGVWDYLDLLDRLDGADDPDYDELWQRVGYDFNPDKVDLAAINQRLHGLSG